MPRGLEWTEIWPSFTCCHTPGTDPPGSHNPPRWSSPGGPAWHSSACSPCAPACGRSRDVDRARGTASAPGPGSSRPCTTSSLSPTSPRTTWGPAGGQRARSRATPSASTNLCATTTQTLCSKTKRTATQTASWLRWDGGNGWWGSIIWDCKHTWWLLGQIMDRRGGREHAADWLKDALTALPWSFSRHSLCWMID